MESEWERTLRRRKEGKCKGGKYREVQKQVTDIELEFKREYQRKYQLNKPRYNYFRTGQLRKEDT